MLMVKPWDPRAVDGDREGWILHPPSGEQPIMKTAGGEPPTTPARGVCLGAATSFSLARQTSPRHFTVAGLETLACLCARSQACRNHSSYSPDWCHIMAGNTRKKLLVSVSVSNEADQVGVGTWLGHARESASEPVRQHLHLLNARAPSSTPCGSKSIDGNGGVFIAKEVLRGKGLGVVRWEDVG